MIGIRLDSGDLAYFSVEARKILDEGGFPHATIFASNDLDETILTSLHQQGAKIGVWAVGTKLVTGYDSPALGGVYKLGALRGEDGKWQPKIKLSEQTAKISIPGLLQVRRFRAQDGRFSADAIYNVEMGIAVPCQIIDPADIARRKTIPKGASGEDLLAPIFKEGKLIYAVPTLPDVQSRARAQLASLHPGIKRLVNPHRYPAGLEKRLNHLRNEMIAHAKNEEV